MTDLGLNDYWAYLKIVAKENQPVVFGDKFYYLT